MVTKINRVRVPEDPHAEREARRYERPIASRELILLRLTDFGAPMTGDEIAGDLGLVEHQDREALRRRLAAMVRDGQLVRNRRDGYCLVNERDLVRGRVVAHPDGFGFLRPDDGSRDLFLSPREMRVLVHDDRVVVRVTGMDGRGRREGAVVEVLERNTRQIVGRYYEQDGVGLVVPDDKRIHHDILIPLQGRGAAGDGQIVVVDLVAQPSERSQPVGRVAEVLGDHMAPGMEIDIAIRSHNLPVVWPQALGEELNLITEEVPDEAIQGRVDLRDLPLVTIDGEDARDFDDAVYCERTPRGWRLLVAIADVSHYVRVGSALDAEARARGTSVYFPERVIPMLPEMLSNGQCSLNPQVDRLCMVCEIYVNGDGKVIRSRFFEGVMRSHARLTYTEVAAMLVDDDAPLRRKHAQLLPHLQDLHDLYRVLRRARETRGAIDFDTTETRIVFGPERKIERIVPLVRNDAHRLIEECMIAANVCASRFLLRRRVPALFRVHARPSEEKLADVRAFLGELGLELGGGSEPAAADYARLLQRVRARSDAHLIQTVLLRSLAQAVYSASNTGHFGLALESYAHFTSPIRRYPDLQVHRSIRHALTDGKAGAAEALPDDLSGLGEHCSATERRADEATRDAIHWLKCEYMMDRVGEEFAGIITGTTSFGLFVELEEIYVDGLIHVTALPRDYYHFDPIGHRLRGERRGVVYRLGDRVRVRVLRVDLDERKIDLELVGETAGRRRGIRVRSAAKTPARRGRRGLRRLH
jgi:ribonuclease R